jgi:DNA-binding response OmpR family regulator
MGKKILVVDDDEGIVEVIQIVLESEGYCVRISMNDGFLQEISQDMPDLILLDVLLAGIDGREICKELKKDPKTCHIPVIMLSAHASTKTLIDGIEANGYLEKPFDVDDLVAIVQKHLSSVCTK